MNKVFPLLIGAVLAVLVVSAFVSCGSHSVTIFNSGTDSGTISGLVVDKTGAGIAGVKVTIGNVSSMTDSSGKYSVENVSYGTYTVTPAKTGYYFLPQTQSIMMDKSQTACKDIVGSTEPFQNMGTVTGKVLDRNGKGIPNVTMTIGEASTLTNSAGIYSVDMLYGSYTVSPAKTGYYFVPLTQDIALNNSQVVMKYDFICDTKPFGNIGDMWKNGYCAQCH